MTPLAWVVIVAMGILVVGMSSVTLAQRKKEPCTACRKAHVEVQRDFSFRCVSCGARFERVNGGLVLREPTP